MIAVRVFSGQDIRLKIVAAFKMLIILGCFLKVKKTLVFSLSESPRSVRSISKGAPVLVVVVWTLLDLVGIIFLKVVLLVVKGKHIPFLGMVQLRLVVLLRSVMVGRGLASADLFTVYRVNIFGLGVMKIWPLLRIGISIVDIYLTQIQVFVLRSSVFVNGGLLVFEDLELVALHEVGFLKQGLVNRAKMLQHQL